MNQSDSDIELEKKFKKFRLEEMPLKKNDELEYKTCNCSSSVVIRSSLLELSINSTKVKTKEKKCQNLIRPARLKVIGSCYARRKKNESESDVDDASSGKIVKDVEDFTSEAFLKMRITPSTAHESSKGTESPLETLDRDDKLPSTSSLNCSTQAKLQQQISSTEFDSTIDEMSDFLAYHLSLFNHPDKYLIDSMYT